MRCISYIRKKQEKRAELNHKKEELEYSLIDVTYDKNEYIKVYNDAKSAFHERKMLSLFKKTNMEEDRILKNYSGKTCYSLIVHFHGLSVNEDVHI